MNVLIPAGLTAAAIAALTVVLLVPTVTRIARAMRAMDYPGGRRQHRDAIPRIGGIAIAAGIAAGAGVPSLLIWGQLNGGIPYFELWTFTAATGAIFLVGCAEDLIGLAPIYRFAVEGVAAAGMVWAGWSFQALQIPFWGEIQLGIWGSALTVLWIVGVTNAINLIDGLDGLAGGVVGIIAASLLVFAYIQGNPATVILMAAMVGACGGFLRHNWAPARIYMGDAGSLTLGFLLGVMSMHASIKGAAAVAILVPILALGLPVIDTLLVMAIRFLEKPQGSVVRRFARMFKADRNHLHHVLALAAPERKHIVVVIYGIAALFCSMALIVGVSRNGGLGTALIAVEVLVVVVIRNLGVRRSARRLALEQRREVRESFFERA